MDHRSPSFEATLLYQTANRPSAASLIEDMKAVVEAHGERVLGVETEGGIFTTLTCDSVQILLAWSPTALPVEHFLGAERPRAACLGEQEVLARLTAAQCAAIVLVLDREGCEAAAELKREVCWDAAECIHAQSAADLVFVADTDTLYAAEEFDRVCSYNLFQIEDSVRVPPFWRPGTDVVAVGTPAAAGVTALDETPEHFIPAHFHEVPHVGEAATAWMGASVEELDSWDHSHTAPRESAALDMLLALAVPTRLALKIDEFQSSYDPRQSKTATLACTAATVGLTCVPNLSTLLT